MTETHNMCLNSQALSGTKKIKKQQQLWVSLFIATKILHKIIYKLSGLKQ